MKKAQLLSTISQIHYLYDRILTDLMRQHQRPRVNAAQARLLISLWEKDGINMQELAERTCLKKTTLSTMLPRLIADGLITVSADSTDHRAKIVHLTDEARVLKDSHQQLYDLLDEVVFSGMDDEDKKVFIRVLIKARENLVKRENEKRGTELYG